MADRLNEKELNCLLFADDIILQTKTTDEMQELLYATSHWCKENTMKINVSKCGTFNETMLKLRLIEFPENSEPITKEIPVVESYKYLGMVCNKDGLDIEQHVEMLKNKTLGTFLMFKNNILSEIACPLGKLQIYKTFIRPSSEYGAPLLVANKITNKQIKPLINVKRDIIRWITGRRGPIKVLNHMSGLYPVKERFELLYSMYINHLRELPLNHPLIGTLEYNENYKLSKLKTHNININEDVGEISKRNLKDIFNVRKPAKGTLCKIMQANQKLYKPDNSLSMKQSKLAIKWRCNGFHNRYTCLKCGNKFTRRHISTCLNIKLSKKLEKEYKSMAGRLKIETFNIIDYLINRNLTKKFKMAMKRLLKGLRPIQNTTNQIP